MKEKAIFFYNRIEKLKKLKEIFSNLKHKDIELWPSLAPSVYYYEQFRTFESFWGKIARIAKFLFFKEKFAVGKEKGKILASILIDRKDHHALWEKMFSYFSEEEIQKVDAFRGGKRGWKSIISRFSLSFPNIFNIVSIYNYLRKTEFSDLVDGRLNRLYLTLLVYYQVKKINYWSKIIEELEPSAYIGYSSYRNNDETIITQLVKKQNKPTFTVQNYSISEFKTFNYEAVTYENFISDYFLVWGESSKDVLSKFIPKSKIIVAGNPNYNNLFQLKKIKFNPKICSVFLSHRQFNSSNYSLVEIMNNFSKEHPEINVNISLHPDSNSEEFSKLIKEKNIHILPTILKKEEVLSESDFIILHNSSISIEGLKYQIPIFRFYDSSTLKKDLPELSFKNKEELERKFKEMFGLGKYQGYAKKARLAYERNFFQPKNSTIPQNYKKIIINLSL